MADKSRRQNQTDAPDDIERMEEEGATGTAVDAAPALADEIVELRKERDSLHDRLLRQAAEFDNYRKRVDGGRGDLSEFAAADVLQAVLPTVAAFEPALAGAPPASGPNRQGLA